MGTDTGADTGPYAIVTGGTAARQALSEQLFAAHYPKLAGWVRRLVDDDDTAHEIASEAFVRLLSKWTTPDKLDSPQSYLYMIATNLVRDHWRKLERERRAITRVTAGVEAEPYSDPSQDVDIRELLAGLPAKLREPFLLHYYAGFGVREIAAQLKKPEGTIKADLYHARAKLKEALAQRTGPQPIQRPGPAPAAGAGPGADAAPAPAPAPAPAAESRPAPGSGSGSAAESPSAPGSGQAQAPRPARPTQERVTAGKRRGWGRKTNAR